MSPAQQPTPGEGGAKGHTPGPWRALSLDGQWFIETSGTYEGGEPWSGNLANMEDYEWAEEDARLIAQAPDLLARAERAEAALERITLAAQQIAASHGELLNVVKDFSDFCDVSGIDMPIAMYGRFTHLRDMAVRAIAAAEQLGKP